MKLTEMNRTINTKKLNSIMESRFGFKIDFDSLTMKKAYTLAKGLTESMSKVRKTHGAHVAEKSPAYMEMLMVRESLHQWMVANRGRFLLESEMAKSEAILAAKDIVDTLQDMLEKVGKLQNEELPALVDTIRDQIGSEQAETFKSTIEPMVGNLMQQLQQGRSTADNASRALAGEQTDQPMDMGMGGDAKGGEHGAADAGAGVGGPESDFDSDDDMGADEFGATDAAAGGESLGRGRR
jgi:hypothetical protein